jgi:TolA-binding protein
VSGSLSDLDKNRALAEWLEYSLRQTRNRIRELEIQEQQEQRRRERARAEQSWKIQPKRTGDTAMLHRGGCTLCADMGFINREEAIIALAEPDIEACQICHPETGLTGV